MDKPLDVVVPVQRVQEMHQRGKIRVFTKYGPGVHRSRVSILLHRHEEQVADDVEFNKLVKELLEKRKEGIRTSEFFASFRDKYNIEIDYAAMGFASMSKMLQCMSSCVVIMTGLNVCTLSDDGQRVYARCHAPRTIPSEYDPIPRHVTPAAHDPNAAESEQYEANRTASASASTRPQVDSLADEVQIILTNYPKVLRPHVIS